jgi:hypothetical protein
MHLLYVNELTMWIALLETPLVNLLRCVQEVETLAETQGSCQTIILSGLQPHLRAALMPAFSWNRIEHVGTANANAHIKTMHILARFTEQLPESMNCLFLGSCWSPAVHQFFSPNFRAAAKTFVFSSGIATKQGGAGLIRLHSRLWIQIFSFAAHERERWWPT